MNGNEFREKVLGAWLGKAVGGTLGAPWEGSTGPHKLSYYNPVPSGMLPNDDLDLQVVWACRLKQSWNYVVTSRNFAQAWLENIDFPYDEYAICRRNLKRGIQPPLSGKYDNFFVDGLGAAIRAEIWACLAPGDPRKAADYAYEDACLDHCGNGIYAEQFIAAMESHAFVDSDLSNIIRAGLSVIPMNSRLYHAVLDTVGWCESGDFHVIREKILNHYGSFNFTDVVMNVPFMVAALLLSKGDFEKAICTAVNFGFDADCTGATVGALLGIIHPDGIPERWLKPIGRSMVLSKEITGFEHPDSLEGFTDLVLELREKAVLKKTIDEPMDLKKFEIPCKSGLIFPWFPLDFNKFSPKLPSDAKTIRLPGNVSTIDLSDMPNDSLLLLQTEFEIAESQTAKVMVNTTANMRVWLDGQFLFGRESGDMLPAFHRTPLNQIAAVEMKQGRHELTIGLAPANPSMKSTPLVFGVGNQKNFWII